MPTGKCVADQGGFADAYKYLQDLKAAGAKYYTDGNALKQDFQTGKLDAIIDGPWQTADFTTAARRQPRRRADPGRRRGDGQPVHRHRRLVHQPQLARTSTSRSKFALQMVIGRPGADPDRPTPATSPRRPASRSTTRSPRASPTRQRTASPARRASEFNNYWAPFGDAVNQVLDNGADPAATRRRPPARP